MGWFRRKKYGKRISEAARNGEEPLKSIVDTARQDGARDEDIEEWWDFPEKFRQSITISENTFRLAMFSELIEGLATVRIPRDDKWNSPLFQG